MATAAKFAFVASVQVAISCHRAMKVPYTSCAHNLHSNRFVNYILLLTMYVACLGINSSDKAHGSIVASNSYIPVVSLHCGKLHLHSNIVSHSVSWKPF